MIKIPGNNKTGNFFRIIFPGSKTSWKTGNHKRTVKSTPQNPPTSPTFEGYIGIGPFGPIDQTAHTTRMQGKTP